MVQMAVSSETPKTHDREGFESLDWISAEVAIGDLPYQVHYKREYGAGAALVSNGFRFPVMDTSAFDAVTDAIGGLSKAAAKAAESFKLSFRLSHRERNNIKRLLWPRINPPRCKLPRGNRQPRGQRDYL